MTIMKRCKKCGGAKWKLVSVKPIQFKPCNKCQGRGGRMLTTHKGNIDEVTE